MKASFHGATGARTNANAGVNLDQTGAKDAVTADKASAQTPDTAPLSTIGAPTSAQKPATPDQTRAALGAATQADPTLADPAKVQQNVASGLAALADAKPASPPNGQAILESKYDEALKSFKVGWFDAVAGALKKDVDLASWRTSYKEGASVIRGQWTVWPNPEGKPEIWEKGRRIGAELPDVVGTRVGVRTTSVTYSNVAYPQYWEGHNFVTGRVLAQDAKGLTLLTDDGETKHFPLGMGTETKSERMAGDFLDRSTLTDEQWQDRNVGAPKLTVRNVPGSGYTVLPLRADEYVPEHRNYLGSIVEARVFEDGAKGRTATKPVRGRVIAQDVDKLTIHTTGDKQVTLNVPREGFLQAKVLEAAS